MPKTALSALASVAVHDIRLRRRGLAFRAGAGGSDEERARIDTLSAAAQALTHADPPRARYYHHRALALALTSGDPGRSLRQLIFERCFRASMRGAAPPTPFDDEVERRIDQLLASIRGDAPDQVAARAFAAFGLGMALAFAARHREARPLLERAEAVLSTCAVRHGNDVTLARVWLVTTLYGLGETAELTRRTAPFLADARAAGDRFAEIQLTGFDAFSKLAADRVSEAEEALSHMLDLLPRRHPPPRFAGFSPTMSTNLYREGGVGEAALRAAPKGAQRLALFFILRINAPIRAYHTFFVALCQLAAGASSSGSVREARLRSVEASASGLSPDATPFATAAASILRAGAAAGRGELDLARVRCEEAEARCARLDMAHYVAALRRRRGVLLGGDEGRALVSAADAEMRKQGIVNPQRITSMYLPGRW